jgi:hypothetical protein
MSTQASRMCPKCKEPRPWRKDRPPGSRSARRLCLTCGAATKPIHGRRKKDTMAPRLYEHRKLRDQNDNLWREWVYRKTKWRDPDDPRQGMCARCNYVCFMQAMHDVGRDNPKTRHDPANGLPGCPRCHRIIDGNSEEKRALFIAWNGREEWERVHLAARTRGKVDQQLVAIGLRALLGER